MFSIDGLMNENQPEMMTVHQNEETTSDVQMETAQSEKVEVIDAIPTGESADAATPQTVTVAPADILAAAAPSLANQEQADVNQKTDSVSQNSDSVNQNAPEPVQNEPEVKLTNQYPNTRLTSSLAAMKVCRTTFTTQPTASAAQVKDAR
jgi:exodeoxyribonuclease VIII